MKHGEFKLCIYTQRTGKSQETWNQSFNNISKSWHIQEEKQPTLQFYNIYALN